MLYPKPCECGLEVADLNKHRKGLTHKNRMMIKRWVDILDQNFNYNIEPVIKEMEKFLE